MRKVILMVCIVMVLTPLLACGKKGPPVLREEKQAPDKAANAVWHGVEHNGRCMA